MKNSALFFIKYYFKKHIGKWVGKGIRDEDIFHKYFYRLHKQLQGKVIQQKEDELLYRFNGHLTPLTVAIRAGASSDIQVLSQVFRDNEYEPLIAEIKKRGKEKQIRFVMDAGTNVGYTTVYLKQFFAGADILAIEPDASNMAQVIKNIELNNLQNIQTITAGLWSQDAWLQLVKPGGDRNEWAFYVTPSAIPTGLRAFSIASLFSRYSFQTIDILKMDIEGSEKELFKQGSGIETMLAKTRFLAMEIHDDKADRPQINNVLKQNNFTWFDAGELTIATNQSLL